MGKVVKLNQNFRKGEKMYEVLESILDKEKTEVIFYCDNDRSLIGSKYNNIKIISSNDLNNVKFDFIIIDPRNDVARKQIKLQLSEMNIDEEKIIDFYDYISGFEYKLSRLNEKKRL